MAQGVRDGGGAESLLDRLCADASPESLRHWNRVLDAHAFPRALARRPLASLSPGERLRAALIALFQRRPAPELRVLDEPSESLDRAGAAALRRVLAAWPGGLLAASHSRELLDALRIEREIALPPRPAGSRANVRMRSGRDAG